MNIDVADDSGGTEVNQRETERTMASPRSLTLTTDVVMNRAGVYDLLALKEVKWIIVDISPLRKLQKINTLSVYGNRITDLDSALHVCRGLPKLRSLDLGGNPCSRDVEGYKFRVVRVLSRLKTLDGDHITQLDKDLTEEFFASMHKNSQSNNGFIGARPFTAPAAPGARGGLTTETLKPNGVDPFASNLMPRGNVRLFRDDFLNNNPILLEYLAENANGASVAEQSSNFTFSSDSGANEDAPTTSSFVDKMRNANPLPNSETDSTGADGVVSSISSDVKKLTLSPSVSTSHLGVDPSDPNTTIRKLLKHIEVLMESLARYKNHQLDAVSESLLEENKQLQTENNNIPILQEQIQDLKKQLVTLENNPSATRLLDTKRMKSLEVLALTGTAPNFLQRENARLREMLLRQTKETEESLENLKSPRIQADGDEATGPKNQDDKMLDPPRLSHSDLLDESALIDVELTELILQNEVSLELIRNDIKNTKKEWEEHFQQAKATEQARVRPQTSLGLSSHNSNRLGGSSDALPAMAQNGGEFRMMRLDVSGRSLNPQYLLIVVTRGRRLHTSAGFHNGPEAHLLGQVAVHPLSSIREASSSDSSTTNILTL
ncbi:hypothetical protein ON010_g7605 [Phytophthora cinnamomi]|nr:hypothetical protein ON010_g7605 [Phytophthora cinnamomi]